MTIVRNIDSKCEIALDALRMVIDPAIGGRIVEFSYHERNVLATSGPQFGSTFWVSPQSLWDWPPPAEIDSAPYSVRIDPDSITLTGNMSPLLGVYVAKRFTVESSIPAVNVEYAIVNAQAEPVTVAAWEVTRVPGGLTFYATGFQRLAKSNLPIVESGGYVWYDYDPLLVEGIPKLFDKSRGGWIANAYNGLLLLKTFDAIKMEVAAPGEAEIEIYAHPDADQRYIEVEQQGQYTRLSPGEQLTWPVKWRLYEIPADIGVSVGSKVLSQWVESLLQA